jgi:hypothetical protein
MAWENLRLSIQPAVPASRAVPADPAPLVNAMLRGVVCPKERICIACHDSSSPACDKVDARRQPFLSYYNWECLAI